MTQSDPARDIKDALAGFWGTAHPTGVVTLEVDDDYRASDQAPALLIANDGGPKINGGPWALRKALRNPLIRITAMAGGRTTARDLVDEAVDWLIDNKPAGIARIENDPEILTTRDRNTLAALAWVEMPVIVKPQ